MIYIESLDFLNQPIGLEQVHLHIPSPTTCVCVCAHSHITIFREETHKDHPAFFASQLTFVYTVSNLQIIVKDIWKLSLSTQVSSAIKLWHIHSTMPHRRP